MVKKEYLLKIVLFSLCYILSAKAGLLLALDGGFATAVWPPAGLALAILLLYGYQMWPAVAIGAFTINFIHGGALATALTISLGNTLEALTAAYFIRNTSPSNIFNQLRGTINFIFAIIAGAAVSAMIGSLAVSMYVIKPESYIETFCTWWLGDTVSCLLIVPFILLFTKSSLKELSTKKISLFFILFLSACYLVFFKKYDDEVIPRAFAYSLFIFALWASVQYNRFIAGLTVFLGSALAITGTIKGHGPFIQPVLNNSLLLLQVFTGILSITALLVSVAVREQILIKQKLKESLKEKELLLSEIHHRVKNNLAVISSLIYLQGEKIEDLKTRKKFKETEGRIRSMALIHEKLYLTENLEKVEFSAYIRDLAQSIRKSYQITGLPVRLELKMDEHFLEITKALPCGLILNEILTNSYKYAFVGRKEGVIEIDFEKKEKGYLLRIKDNGIGFTRNSENPFPGLGLTLVNSLIDQIGGTMEVKSDNGTIFEFNFS